MGLIKTRGLIIREQPFKEQDKLITIFTEAEGKRKAIAKGARRSKSSLIASTQLFSYGEFIYYSGRGLATINQAYVIESFYSLRQNINKMSLGSYVLEMLDGFYDDFQGNSDLLTVANHLLYYISENKAKSDQALIIGFQIKLLKTQGLAPTLTKCFVCGNTTDLTSFSLEGGALCNHCSKNVPYKHFINPKTLEIMAVLLKSPIKNICEIELDVNWADEIMNLMNDILMSCLQKKMKAYEFYKSLKMNNSMVKP